MAEETSPTHSDACRAVCIGAGGHAKSVLAAAIAAGDLDIVGVLDARPELKGTSVLGYPVLGDDSLLPNLLRQGVNSALLGVGAVGDQARRIQVFDRVSAHGFKLPPIIHPRATVDPTAAIGAGTCVMAGAVINADAAVGANVIVNSGAVIEHDCTVSDHVHIAPRAVLAGLVWIGRGAHVGLGACVREGVRIGEHAIVGAGAVVLRDVAPRTLVVGVPARLVRTLA